MKKLLFAVFVLLFAVSCVSTETIESTNVVAEEVYQDYDVRLSKNSSNALATFRVRGKTGTTIDLDAPAKIELNGKAMTESKPGFLTGTNYQFFAPSLGLQYQFLFTNADGKTYQNETSLMALELTATTLNLSKSQPTAIPLSRALAADEELEVVINGQAAADEKASSLVSTGLKTDASRAIGLLDPKLLKDVAAGEGELRVECSKGGALKQHTKAGGAIKITYSAASIPVKIVN